MKKIADKVAIVALVCVSAIFVLTTLLCLTGAVAYVSPDNVQGETLQNNLVNAIMFVLTAAFVGLAVYVLYRNFSERAQLKELLLFCDSDSATRTNLRVVNNIVRGCAKQVEGLKVRKIKVRSDEKGGFVATVCVKTDAEHVAQSVNKLRCLLCDSFLNTLGIVFNTLNFEVEKLNGKYQPNIEEANKLADNLQANQEVSAKNYTEPMAEEEPTIIPAEETPTHASK